MEDHRGGTDMADTSRTNEPEQETGQGVQYAGGVVSFTDMLQELRILQLGVQVLSAFLITLPFTQRFAVLGPGEQWVYVATFVCTISSLIFMSAPAAQHTLERPLGNRARFKAMATRLIIVGLVFFSLALVLASQLVVYVVAGLTPSYIVAACVAGLIGVLWWLIPLTARGG